MTLQHREPDASVTTLLAMLTFCRPASSKTERRFIRQFLKPLGMEQDEAGNLIKRIGDAPILWSSHTDTVHRKGGFQKVAFDGRTARLAPGSKSNCLGADCTAGVWLMREMILANRPGLYVFHRGEECGGIGSGHIERKTPKLLDGIKFAIAFDRYGRNSIITHQGGQRGASDAFVESLAEALGMDLRADSGGTFTDTANYVDLVSECTNVSVGYDKQHSSIETQDTHHLLDLRDALLKLDADDLVAEREPGSCDFDWNGHVYWDNQTALNDYTRCNGGYGHTKRSMEDLVRTNPNEVADLLEHLGLDAEQLALDIYVRGGVI